MKTIKTDIDSLYEAIIEIFEQSESQKFSIIIDTKGRNDFLQPLTIFANLLEDMHNNLGLDFVIEMKQNEK